MKVENTGNSARTCYPGPVPRFPLVVPLAMKSNDLREVGRIAGLLVTRYEACSEREYRVPVTGKVELLQFSEHMRCLCQILGVYVVNPACFRGLKGWLRTFAFGK